MTDDLPPIRIFLSPPDVGEGERMLLLDAFDSNWIAPLGPHVDGFEAEMADRLGGGVHCVALSSGAAALHLALLDVGVGPGDEVLTSTMTFAATANAIRYVGATPVFVDVDPVTWQMDPNLAVGVRAEDDVLCPTLTAPATVHAVEQVGATPVFVDAEPTTWNVDPDLVVAERHAATARNNLPSAVVTVDLYGQCADHDTIVDIAHHYDVPVIEDAAEALGATYKGRPAGTLGDFGIFSFGSEQVDTTSSGGMLVTPDADLARRARRLLTPTDGQTGLPSEARPTTTP